MIQVYKKNELFIIEDTVRDTLYPNLTREEAIKLLKEFDRKNPEERVDYAITDESYMDFEYKELPDPNYKAIDCLEQVKEYISLNKNPIKYMGGLDNLGWFVDRIISKLKERSNEQN